MESLDLDSLPAPWIDRLIAQRRHPGSRTDRYHGDLVDSDHKGPGLRYETLLDWRGLERAWHRMSTRARKESATFWEEIRALRAAAGVAEVWVPEPDGVYTMIFTDDGMSTRKTTELIDRAIGRPQYRSVVLSDGLGERYKEWWAHSERLYRRANWLMRRFMVAVEARLKAHVDAGAEGYRRGLLDPSIFLVENDGRTHVVLSDHYGVLKWCLPETTIVRLV